MVFVFYYSSYFKLQHFIFNESFKYYNEIRIRDGEMHLLIYNYSVYIGIYVDTIKLVIM